MFIMPKSVYFDIIENKRCTIYISEHDVRMYMHVILYYGKTMCLVYVNM